MPSFAWRAVDGQGRAHRGVVEAASAAAARQALRERALLPLAVEPGRGGAAPTTAAGAGSIGSIGSSSAGRLSPRALALVTRQLATLIASDVPIDEALATVAGQSPPRHRALILAVRDGVREGRSLADALAAFPGAFGGFYRATVAAGEQSGRLGRVMEHLADAVEQRQRNRQTVLLALLYPALLLLVSSAIIAALLVFVMPDIVRVFTARDADLPTITRVLIAVSGFLQAWGLWLLLGLAALGLTLRLWLSRPAPRLALDRMLARATLTRGLVRRASAAQLAGTLATLLQSGVPLIEALAAAAATTRNRFIRARLLAAAAQVRDGQALSRALREADVFPPMLVALVASGEASGTLGAALARAASDQQRDLSAFVATLVGLVEPAVLLLMGGIVLALVLAVILPIVAMTSLTG